MLCTVFTACLPLHGTVLNNYNVTQKQHFRGSCSHIAKKEKESKKKLIQHTIELYEYYLVFQYYSNCAASIFMIIKILKLYILIYVYIYIYIGIITRCAKSGLIPASV